MKVAAPSVLKCFHFRVMEEASIAAEGYSAVPAWNVGSAGRALQRGHSYHWSCRVWDQGGWSPWFVPDWRFTVGSTVSAPNPKLPADKSAVRERKPILVVSPVPGASYRFQLWQGKSLVEEGVTTQAWWCSSTILRTGVEYSWTCRAETRADTSAWFAPMWSFEVSSQTMTEASEQTSLPGRRAAAGAAPNPFRDFVTIVPGAGSEPITRIVIYSSDGRTVRELAGRSWDGRDRAGAAVRPGTYLVRTTGGGQEELLRIVKVR